MKITRKFAIAAALVATALAIVVTAIKQAHHFRTGTVAKLLESEDHSAFYKQCLVGD